MGNAVSMPPLQADQVAEPTPDNGESRATVVERLFREHNEALIRFLRGRVGSHNEALEVAQESYVMNQIHGLDAATIASRLGISDSMVRKYVVRALLLCRAHIDIERNG